MAASVASKGYNKLSGVVFGMFKNRKTILTHHPMDTNYEQYFRVLENIVIPEAINIAPEVPNYPERVKQLLTHTNPAFHPSWNFSAELMYRCTAEEAHQTEENITKAYLLRASMDLLCTMSAVLDDCSDNSDSRRGKRTWHTFCTGGTAAAIWDGSLIGLIPSVLLKKYFRNDPGYTQMLEIINMANTYLMIGQNMDVLYQGSGLLSVKEYEVLCYYKTAAFSKIASGFGVLHAGVVSDHLVELTMDVFNVTGKGFQIWDDFTDYYCTSEQTGKPACDLANGGTTWVSTIAMEHFNEAQAKEFKSCYGSPDPAKMKRVRELYDEIDMCTLYVNYMRDMYFQAEKVIKMIPHSRIQNGCYQYLNWLIGRDVL